MTSISRRREHDDSGEYSDASQDNDQRSPENESGQVESDYDSRSDSYISEKDPDGEEQNNQETERRVDDDEDRSNPQYIPKRGTFYEHDDRTADTGLDTSNTTGSEQVAARGGGGDGPRGGGGGDSETPAGGGEQRGERRRAPRKSDTIDKWSHDKFNENDQCPKSRDELVAIYGYDIRNEDAPPHARRNRRYGRGPNKYTRTWEDEEAYKRQGGPPPPGPPAGPRAPPTAEDFPELETSGKRTSKKRLPRPRSKSTPASNESLDASGGGETPRRGGQGAGQTARTPRSPRTAPRRPAAAPQPAGAAPPASAMPNIENLSITAAVNNHNGVSGARRLNVSVAQQRPVPTAQGKPQQSAQQQPTATPKPVTHSQHSQPARDNQPAPAGATGAAESRGSKRYSSLRQRPLAEPYAPQSQSHQQSQQSQQHTQLTQPQQSQQPQPPQHRYEYPAGQPNSHQPGQMHQVHPQQIIHQQMQRNAAAAPPQHGPLQHGPNQHGPSQHGPSQHGPAQHGPSPPHQAMPQPHAQQQVRLNMLEQQQLVSLPQHHQLHNLPPHNIVSGQLSSPGYVPPAMLPPPYIQQAAGGGSAPVYGGAAIYGAPAQYHQHQMYQHHNYATAGVTYYSPVEQEPPPPAPAPRPPRRATAAIPIVKPQQDRAPNSVEKDNIDRIVENMFVRKPWPANSTEGKDKASAAEPGAGGGKDDAIADSADTDTRTGAPTDTDTPTPLADTPPAPADTPAESPSTPAPPPSDA